MELKAYGNPVNQMLTELSIFEENVLFIQLNAKLLANFD